MLLLLLPLLLGRDGAEGQSLGLGTEFRLHVRSPQTVQVGLHLHVPCTVKYPRKDWIHSDPAYGFWFRKGAHVFRDLPVATNKPGVEVQKETRGRFLLLGDLWENNCSLDIRDVRMEDAGSYFFRLERGRLKYTYLPPEVSVNVTDSPWNMTIRVIQGNDTESIIAGNGSSVHVQEGQWIHLICAASSNPPAKLSWARGRLNLSPSQPLNPGVLELSQVEAGDGGEFTCLAQNPLGSQHSSLKLFVHSSHCHPHCVSGEPEGSWPLIVTLLRGGLMGAGFLLTYGFTWIYYTRCRDFQKDGSD